MDEKDKAQLIGGMQRLASGALGVGVTLATKDPMAGMAASAAAMTATDYMKSKLSGENADLVVAEENVLLDYCAKLDERVRKIEERLFDTGQKPDRQDLLSKEVTFSRFAKGLGEAATVEKREALVHATAYQFDPRKGSPATRDYWLRKVRDASDAEISLVNLLVEHKEIAFLNNEAIKTSAQENTTFKQKLPMLVSEVVALETLSQQISATGHGQVVYSPARRNVHGHMMPTYALTAVGTVFASFCKDD